MNILEAAFPALQQEGYTETSPASSEYNCIAWAANRTDTSWWPDPQGVGYWPEGVPRTETLDAFHMAFESIGYSRCANGQLEPGFEKVALYALAGQPKHAARQLPDGRWTSKLGKYIDISHALGGVEGPVYGQVAGYLKRATTSA
jgi:hypothetical protein